MKCLANDRSARVLVRRTREEVVQYYAILFSYVLADKYGFGQKKLHQILKTVVSLSEEIGDDEIKLEELEQVLNEEYNIIVR